VNEKLQLTVSYVTVTLFLLG